MTKPIDKAYGMKNSCPKIIIHCRGGSASSYDCEITDIKGLDEPCTMADWAVCPFNPEFKKPQTAPPEKPTSKNYADDLKNLEFKDAGELYNSGYKYFKLVKSKVEPLIKNYDLTVPAQRKLAWLDILEHQRRQPHGGG